MAVVTVQPREGFDRCVCGVKYWDLIDGKWVCHGCGEKYRRWCEQECGRLAYGYGMDPHPQGWAGWYCQTCMNALKFHCVDVIRGA